MHVYESGSSRGGFGSFGPETVLEIRLTPDNQVQYVDDGYVFYTSENAITWPLRVAVALHTVQAPSFSHVEYLQ